MPDKDEFLQHPLLEGDTLEKFFDFLEVDISASDKAKYLLKLEDSVGHPIAFQNLYEFSDFETEAFIHNDYKKYWMETNVKEPVNLLTSEGRQYALSIEKNYSAHIKAFRSKDSNVKKEIHNSLLRHKSIPQNYKGPLSARELELKFLNAEQSQCKNQLESLKRLYDLTTKIEGEDFLTSSTPCKISTLDYRRWADQYAKETKTTAQEGATSMKLSKKHMETSETTETSSLMTRVALTSASIALAGAAIATGNGAMFAMASLGASQANEGCDTVTSLINSVLFMSDNQTNSGLINLGIGVTHLASQALNISATVLPSAFSAAAVTGFSFMTPACSLAMIGLYQHQMNETKEKVEKLKDSLSQINQEIESKSPLSSEQVAQLKKEVKERLSMLHTDLSEFTNIIQTTETNYKKQIETADKLKSIGYNLNPKQKAALKEEKIKIDTLHSKRQELVQTINELEKSLAPQAKQSELESSRLIDARKTLTHTLEKEKATYGDAKKNRNLWTAIGVTSTAVVTASTLATSTVSAGIVPVAVGIGLGTAFIAKEYYISGKYSQSEAVAKSNEKDTHFNQVLHAQDAFKTQTGISLSERLIIPKTKFKPKVKLSFIDHIHDLRAKGEHEQVDKINLALLEIMKAEKGSSQSIEAQSKLMEAVAIPTKNKEKLTGDIKGLRVVRVLLNCKVAGLDFLNAHKEDLFKEAGIDLNKKITLGSDFLTMQTNMSLPEQLDILANKQPQKAQAVISSLMAVINSEPGSQRNEAKQVLNQSLIEAGMRNPEDINQDLPEIIDKIHADTEPEKIASEELTTEMIESPNSPAP